MKHVSRESGKLVIRLEAREYDALQTAIKLRGHLPRRARPLTGDASTPPALQDAEKDLTSALAEHRRELTAGMETLLSDPERCSLQARGARHLTLNPADADLMLQTLNDLKVSAWERLGCPDFESGERPAVSEDNLLYLWALQVTDLFQAFLLDGLTEEE